MRYFTLRELTASSVAEARGIDNTPTLQAEAALVALVDLILDPLREAYGRPIRVNSGYRCPALNKAVGGASASQHVKGQAADITTGTRRGNKVLFDLVQHLGLPFDQLIYEHGTKAEGPDWVHVSYDPKRSRRQVLYIGVR